VKVSRWRNYPILTTVVFGIVAGLIGAGLATNFIPPLCFVIEGQPRPWFTPNRFGMMVGVPVGTVIGFLVGMVRQRMMRSSLEE